MSYSIKKRSSGLTLIEVLGALMLISLLAAALLAVLSVIARQSAAPSIRHFPPMDGLLKIIRSDLAHSSEFRMQDQAVQLKTLTCLTGIEADISHENVEVRYSIRKWNENSCLVRHQITKYGIHREDVLAAHIQAISIYDNNAADESTVIEAMNPDGQLLSVAISSNR